MTEPKPAMSYDAGGGMSASRKRLTVQDALNVLDRIAARGGTVTSEEINLLRAILQQAQIAEIEDYDAP